MKREDRKKILFGHDEIYDNIVFRKAKDISFFKNISNFNEVVKIIINSNLDIKLLGEINEVLILKPSIQLDISLHDSQGFQWESVSSALSLSLSFDRLSYKVDLKKLY